MVEKYRYFFVFLILAFISDAIGDAIKFSGAYALLPYVDDIDNAIVYGFFMKNLDWIWHVLKWFIEMPLWLISGYYLINYWIKNKLNDVWHPQIQHVYVYISIIVSIIIWQIVYSIIRKFLV